MVISEEYGRNPYFFLSCHSEIVTGYEAKTLRKPCLSGQRKYEKKTVIIWRVLSESYRMNKKRESIMDMDVHRIYPEICDKHIENQITTDHHSNLLVWHMTRASPDHQRL